MNKEDKFFTFLIIIILSVSFLGIKLSSAEAPTIKAESVEIVEAPAEKQYTTKDDYISLTEKYAEKYNVSATVMKRVIDCENNTWNPKRQSEIINKSGIREDSWGLVQIHLPSHSHITREEATDPEFSIEFMAIEFSKGRQSKWSCYKKIYNQ